MGHRYTGLVAVAMHSARVPARTAAPHIVGTYAAAFPLFTMMVEKRSMAGETTMQVSAKTRAPLPSICVTVSRFAAITSREANIQSGILAWRPARSPAMRESSSPEQ